MAKDKELNKLAQKLVPMPLPEQLQRDMDKWAATIGAGGANANKQAAIKRLMLLIGSGNLEIFGNKFDDKYEVEQGQILASSNNLPIAFYLSGHGGRVYMSLGGESSDKVLNWVTDYGIHKGRYFLPVNREGELKGKEIVYDRHAGTHSAEVDEKGNITELKGAWYGIFGILGRVLNYITFGFFLSQYSQHLGMNLPFGGAGKKYQDVTGNIEDGGKSGHLYINAGNNFLGIGMEGTAPGSEGPLGAHSKSGAADRFTPGEGQKSFVKFDLKDENFLAYLEAVVADDQNNYRMKWTQVKTDYEKYKIQNAKDISKATLEEQVLILRYLGLHVLTDKDGKPTMVSTTLGTAMMGAGMVVPYNYNGQKIKYSKEALEGILQHNKALPDEIIYFKPRENLQKFMAQARIFACIDEKPLIKNNPQLSLKECFALSLLYSLRPDVLKGELKTVLNSESFQVAMEEIGDMKLEVIKDYNDALKKVLYKLMPPVKEHVVVKKPQAKAEETKKLEPVTTEESYLNSLKQQALAKAREGASNQLYQKFKDSGVEGDIKDFIAMSLLYDAQAKTNIKVTEKQRLKNSSTYKSILNFITIPKKQATTGLRLSDESDKPKSYEELLNNVLDTPMFKK